MSFPLHCQPRSSPQPLADYLGGYPLAALPEVIKRCLSKRRVCCPLFPRGVTQNPQNTQNPSSNPIPCVNLDDALPPKHKSTRLLTTEI